MEWFVFLVLVQAGVGKQEHAMWRQWRCCTGQRSKRVCLSCTWLHSVPPSQPLACSLEHCIANLFFVPLGIFVGEAVGWGMCQLCGCVKQWLCGGACKAMLQPVDNGPQT